MTTALLEAAGLSVGTVHQPAPRSGSTSAWSWNGEPIADDDLDELLVAVADGRGPPARRAELLRDPHRRRAARGSPTSRSTSRWSRWAWAAPGTPPTWSTADVAVVTNVSIDHVEYLGPTRADIAAEKAGIVKPGVDARARRDRSRRSCRIFLAREPGAVVAARPSTSACASNALAVGGRVRRPVHARTRSYDEVFLPLHGAHQADNARGRAHRGGVRSSGARSATSSSPTRSRRCESPGRLEVVATPAARPARRREERRRRARAARRARRGVRRLAAHARRRPAAREGAARDARRARRASTRRALVCCRPDSPRGATPRRSPTPRYELGVDRERVEVIDDVARRGRARDRRRRPPTARSSSPARSTWSARPGVLVD